MIEDAGPMAPCPARKSGAHRFASYGIEDGASSSVTLACEACGSVRRIPATGALLPLDDALPDRWLSTRLDTLTMRGTESR